MSRHPSPVDSAAGRREAAEEAVVKAAARAAVVDFPAEAIPSTRESTAVEEGVVAVVVAAAGAAAVVAPTFRAWAALLRLISTSAGSRLRP